MSDSDSSPRSPFAPLQVSHGNSVGFSDSPNPGSRPRDHRSQVSRRSQGSHTRTCAQHICGLPQLSLHGFGLPTPTSEVFYTSHRDSVKSIQHCGNFPSRSLGWPRLSFEFTTTLLFYFCPTTLQISQNFLASG